MEFLYKIRRPSDGLFFSGAGYRKKTWTTNGRSYNSVNMARGAIRTSIRQGDGDPEKYVDPNDVEIVEYEVRETRTIVGI